MDSNKKPAILKWALILSIVIITNLFLNVAVDLAYERPDYDDYCMFSATQTIGSNGVEKLDYGSQKECREKYDTYRELFERNVFITLISAGVVILIISLILKSNALIASALSLAAVLNFVIASMRYWGSAHELTKLIILAIALVALIYIAYKKFSDKI